MSPPIQKSYCFFFIKQDQLMLYVIVAFVSPSLTTFISACTTSKFAWDKYKIMYGKPSRGCIISIQDDLTKISKNITTYMQLIQSHEDEITVLDFPLI